MTIDHSTYETAELIEYKILIAKLVTLIRVGFLVRVDGERATIDTVRNVELHKLLMTILQAEDSEIASFTILKEKPNDA